MIYRFRAYIRAVGTSTPLIETVQADFIGEVRAMAKASIERLSLAGDMPDGGFYHIRDMKQNGGKIIEDSTLIRPL